MLCCCVVAFKCGRTNNFSLILDVMIPDAVVEIVVLVTVVVYSFVCGGCWQSF